MSTHNIGFYEDLTKIIFELSSNIIKYAPYFFSLKGLKIETISATFRFGDTGNRSLCQYFGQEICIHDQTVDTDQTA